MEEYRKCIFGAMHGAKVVEYGPSPWMAYNPVKRIQDPIPALVNAVSRSIKNKRRGTRIVDFDVFLKKTSERLRRGRAEEQKQRRDARVLKLAADAIAQRKMDESAKMQTQNIEVADEAVGILMLSGFGEHMKARKGKKRDKHIKELLDANLRAPLPGDGNVGPPEAPDDSEKDGDTSSQEQIAKLKFEQGRSREDPPEGAKNRRYALFTKRNAPRGVITFEHEYNFFKGMKADNTIMDIQLNPAWCENVFELVFTQLCRLHPGNWFHVPIGSTHGVPGVVTSPPFTSVAVRYQQKDRDYRLPYLVALCLNYMGHVVEARKVAAAAPDFVSLPGDVAIERLRAIMMGVLPQMGQCMVWNVRKRRRNQSRKEMLVGEIVQSMTPHLTVEHPKGMDGSSDHAVCVVDDIVFYASFTHALKLREESFDWVCGPRGMAELGQVIRFCLPHGVPKRKRERPVQRNWN
jgi:hypothetical protein